MNLPMVATAGGLVNATPVDLAERFLASLDVRQVSRNTYRRQIRRFFQWLDTQNLTALRREDILTYKAFLAEEGLSSLSVSGYMVAVRRFFEWAEGEKIYPNVAKGIKGAKRARNFRKDPLTVPQAKGLLSSVDRETLQGKRDFAILNLLIRTGMRTVEAIRANVDDIRQESGEAVLWIHGKGRDSKDDFCVLTDETLAPIRDYLTARGKIRPGAPLFASLSPRNEGGRLTTRSVSRIAKEKLKGVGIVSDRITAHSLRHSAVTFSLLGGATLQEAQKLARHSDINTTLIYAHNISRVSNAPERRIDALLG